MKTGIISATLAKRLGNPSRAGQKVHYTTAPIPSEANGKVYKDSATNVYDIDTGERICGLVEIGRLGLVPSE